MGESARDRDDLAASAIWFKVRIRPPKGRSFSYKYGPYQGWIFAAFDVGQVIGYAQGKGTPTSQIEIEWYIGDQLIETKDLGHGRREEEPTAEDPGRGQAQEPGS